MTTFQLHEDNVYLRQELAKNERRWRMITGKIGTAELDIHSLYLDIMSNLFNHQELVTLCFQLGIDHEKLNDETKEVFAREIIRFCQRNNINDRLHHLIIEKRPFLHQK